jgi:hypothetical protein
MLQIRLNAFETNSSSVHSFYIKKGFEPSKSKEPIVLDAKLCQFGWDFECFNNVCFIDYVWTAICDKPEQQEYQERIEHILAPYNITVNWQETNADSFWIDHDDEFCSILDELLKKPELFLSAVLCPDSYFLTGNDNSNQWVERGEITDYENFVKSN